MKNMVGFTKKGTQKEQVNYEGILYLFEVKDWNLFVYGNTYEYRSYLKGKGYWWDDHRMAWYKNFTSEAELESDYIEMESLDFTVEVQSIFRQVRPVDQEVTV